MVKAGDRVWSLEWVGTRCCEGLFTCSFAFHVTHLHVGILWHRQMDSPAREYPKVPGTPEKGKWEQSFPKCSGSFWTASGSRVRCSSQSWCSVHSVSCGFPTVVVEPGLKEREKPACRLLMKVHDSTCCSAAAGDGLVKGESPHQIHHLLPC